MKKNLALELARYVSLALILVWGIWPFVYALTVSLRPDPEIFSRPFHWIPWEPTLKHYIRAFEVYNYAQYALNGLIIAAGGTLIAMLVAIPAAYALGRKRFPASRLIFYSIVITMLFPGILLIIPLYLIFLRLGLVNTYPGLWIAIGFGAAPLQVWILRDFFAKLPVEVEEAAMLDGCSAAGAFFRVVLPLARPAIGASLALSFLGGWQNFITVFILGSSSMYNAVCSLYYYSVGTEMVFWGELMASAIMTMLPVTILYFFIQKFVVRGLSITVAE